MLGRVERGGLRAGRGRFSIAAKQSIPVSGLDPLLSLPKRTPVGIGSRIPTETSQLLQWY